MVEPHWHWTFFAFDEYAADGVNVQWPVEVTVTGKYDEDAARVIASGIVQRQHYKLRRVWDCMTCGFQEANSEALRKLADAAS